MEVVDPNHSLAILKLLESFKEGDLLEINRWLYSHWVLYEGDGNVIHVACDGSRYTNVVERFLCSLFKKAVVRRDKLVDVLKGSVVVANNKMDEKFAPMAADEIINAARSMIGQEGYSIFGNCESLCNLWRYGVPTSLQIVAVLEFIMAVGAGIIVGGITKEFLEDEVGFTWAMVAGVTAGGATTFLLLKTVADSMVTDALVIVVAKVGEFAVSGWVAAAVTNVIAVSASGLLAYGLYKLVTSERFKTTVRSGKMKFSSWIDSFANLITRSLSGSRSTR